MTNWSSRYRLSSLQSVNLVIAIIGLVGVVQLGSALLSGAIVESVLGLTVMGMSIWAFYSLHERICSVQKAVDVANRAANGDLNVRIVNISGSGPIETLMHNINRLMDQADVFTRESTASMQLAAEGEYYRHIPLAGSRGSFTTRSRFFNDGLEAMDRRTLTFAEESSQLGEKLKEVVRSMSSAASNLKGSAEELDQTASGTSEQAANASQGAEITSSNVSGVAAATEEFSTSISEVANQVQRSAHMAGEAVARAQDANTTIHSLSESAERIGEVVAMINDIASQTNLLALNATIEAARAGESGKGFAVVAGEVKSLANQTAGATVEISKQIEDMQLATRQAVEAIAAVDASIQEMDQGTSTIAGTVENQQTVVTEISANIQTAANGVSSVANSIAEVAGGTQESSSAVIEIGNISTELSTIATQLNGDVEAFVDKVSEGR